MVGACSFVVVIVIVIASSSKHHSQSAAAAAAAGVRQRPEPTGRDVVQLLVPDAQLSAPCPKVCQFPTPSVSR